MYDLHPQPASPIPPLPPNFAMPPKKNRPSIKIIIIAILIILPLAAITTYYFTYQTKQTKENTAVPHDIKLSWQKFIDAKNPLAPVRNFSVTYKDTSGPQTETTQGDILTSWELSAKGKTIIDGQYSQNYSNQSTYTIRAGDVGLFIDLDSRYIGTDFYINIDNNPLFKLLAEEFNPKKQKWIKIALGKNREKALNQQELNSLAKAWDINNILTTTNKTIEQPNDLTAVPLTINQEGVDAAIDTSIRMYALQILSQGSVLTPEEQKNAALALKFLARKISVKNITAYINSQQQLVRISGSITAPSLLHTIRQLDEQTQTVIISTAETLLSPLSNANLATRYQPKTLGKVLGISTTQNLSGQNPLDVISFSATINFELEFTGYGSVQQINTPQDFLDITPYLEDLENNLQNKITNT